MKTILRNGKQNKKNKQIKKYYQTKKERSQEFIEILWKIKKRKKENMLTMKIKICHYEKILL